MSFKIKNFTMRAFNNDVNNTGNLSDKYSDWSAYRNDVTQFVKSAAHGSQDAKSIIVLGSGECNDVDLKFLLDNFERVVLTDVDEQSIYDGIARQGIADAMRFEVFQTEYTGLENAGFFDTLSALCSDNTPVLEICEFIKNALTNVRSADMSKLAEGGFDVVLSCPIYTQILFTQAEVLMEILAHYSTYSHDDMHMLLQSVSNNMPALIKKYNDLLLSVTNPNGKLVVLSDVIETHPDGELVQTISEILAAQPVDSHALEHLIHGHGLKFGTLGRHDLLHKTDVTDSLWCLWPFDENRHYLVSGILASKK
ncbi:MAG: hypothetical protein HN948_04255 [Clostridia bacterium]|jgi:hypothetical protein|nr:hypothetical protein [Clostridia bacterium]MBT7122208.1 hypothetical protein [Clostridia bacterium]